MSKPEFNRLGPQEKCPACGWRLDPGAYRCPKCRIYFCFKCRRRVIERDAQYQCLNQQCLYYGKLLCEVCTESVPEYEDRQVPHYSSGQSGVWRIFSIAAGVVGVIVWIVSGEFAIGLLCAVAGLVGGAVFASKNGWAWFDKPGSTNYTTERYQTGDHKACIACKQPVEVLRG
jgi:hypothetical protein